MDLSTPPEIPGFRLLHSIGSGAYGEVWLGQDVVLGVYRAIKVVWLVHDSDRTPAERDGRRHRAERVLRGLQEYLQRVSVLSFPAIAVLELKVDPTGRFFHYTMPLADDARTGRELNPVEQPIEGYLPRTLSSVCAEQDAGHLPVKVVIRIGTRLAEALSQLHEAGIVHQDIKPSNIIFLRGEPTFADVDLVRDLDATRTIAGTAGYVPPEGTGTVGADIYSLGKTLYVMATGQSAQTRSLTPAGDWDRSVDAVALANLMQIWSRACEDSPLQRYATARELADELRLLEAGRSIQQLRRLEHFKKRYQRIALIAIPLLIVLVGLTVFLQRQSKIQSFALYQASMAKAVTNLRQGRLGLARDALLDPSIIAEMRGPEWNSLWHQIEGDPVVRISHPKENIERLVFSPNGQRIAVQSGGVLYVHQFQSTNIRPGVVRSQHEGEGVHDRLFSPSKNVVILKQFNVIGGWLDSEHVLGTSRAIDDRPLRVWSIKEPDRPKELRPGNHWLYGPGSSQAAFAVVTNSESGPIGIGSSADPENIRWVQWGPPPPDSLIKTPLIDDFGRILVQHVQTGLGDTFTTHLYFKHLGGNAPEIHEVYPLLEIKAMALSPDGARFAYSETRTGELTVRSGNQFQEKHREAFNAIYALAFSPDGTRLASGGDDEQVRIHDARTLQVLREFRGHYAQINSLAWSPDGNRLASGDKSGEIRVWQLNNPPMHWDSTSGLKSGGKSPMMVVDPSGASLAISGPDHSIRILECNGFRTLRSNTNGHTPLYLHDNDIWMLAATPDQSSALLRESIGLGIQDRYEIQGALGDVFGYGSSIHSYGMLHDSANRVGFIKLPPSRAVSLVQRHVGDYIDDAAISRSGTRAVTVGDGRANFWKIPSAEQQILPRIAIFFCADFVDFQGSQCLLGSDGFTVYRVSVDDSTLLPIQTLIEQNFAIVVDAESDRFYTGGASGRIHVGRLSDGKPLVVLEHPELLQRKGEHRIRRLAYNPVLKDLYAITDGGILARWRMAPVEPE